MGNCHREDEVFPPIINTHGFSFVNNRQSAHLRCDLIREHHTGFVIVESSSSHCNPLRNGVTNVIGFSYPLWRFIVPDYQTCARLILQAQPENTKCKCGKCKLFLAQRWWSLVIFEHIYNCLRPKEVLVTWAFLCQTDSWGQPPLLPRTTMQAKVCVCTPASFWWVFPWQEKNKDWQFLRLLLNIPQRQFSRTLKGGLFFFQNFVKRILSLTAHGMRGHNIQQERGVVLFVSGDTCHDQSTPGSDQFLLTIPLLLINFAKSQVLCAPNHQFPALELAADSTQVGQSKVQQPIRCPVSQKTIQRQTRPQTVSTWSGTNRPSPRCVKIPEIFPDLMLWKAESILLWEREWLLRQGNFRKALESLHM